MLANDWLGLIPSSTAIGVAGRRLVVRQLDLRVGLSIRFFAGLARQDTDAQAALARLDGMDALRGADWVGFGIALLFRRRQLVFHLPALFRRQNGSNDTIQRAAIVGRKVDCSAVDHKRQHISRVPAGRPFYLAAGDRAADLARYSVCAIMSRWCFCVFSRKPPATTATSAGIYASIEGLPSRAGELICAASDAWNAPTAGAFGGKRFSETRRAARANQQATVILSEDCRVGQ